MTKAELLEDLKDVPDHALIHLRVTTYTKLDESLTEESKKLGTLINEIEKLKSSIDSSFYKLQSHAEDISENIERLLEEDGVPKEVDGLLSYTREIPHRDFLKSITLIAGEEK